MPKLVIVSNRLPITIHRKEGTLSFVPSTGGLATGLNSVETDKDRLWIGWVGAVIEDEQEKLFIKEKLYKDGIIPIFLSSEAIELFYEGFSNKTIWPHFHYFTQYTTYLDSYWEAYQEVNQLFADVVGQYIEEDDIVWVHDYQLLLLPALIRKKASTIKMGFFLHIPFPSYETFRILPWRKELLNGILGADQIGFHTFGYMRHFLSATYRITGHEHNFGKLTLDGRVINTDVFPMGIDYEKYANREITFDNQDRAFYVERIAKKCKLIISIDRLDYTKGILQRIRCFERFLIENKDYLGKVILFLIVVPSRSNVDQYQELKEEVDTMVGRINAAYGSFSWFPIHYYYRALAFSEIMTLYREAHIAFITPLRDGMNLVAKEFIASKDLSQKGVLILSEMAGASKELTDALIVNPQDTASVVAALKQALEMTHLEQSWRLRKMQAQLKKHDIRYWAKSFIRELTKDNQHKEVQLNQETIQGILKAYRQSKRRLFLLDYDGTLMDFKIDPQAVQPDNELLILLEKISANTNNKAVINTGRDKDTIHKWLGHLALDFATEHGVWIRKDAKWSRKQNLNNQWKQQIYLLLEQLVERTPGSFIEDKDFSLVWHYRQVDKELGAKRVREFKDVLVYLIGNLNLQVLDGNKVVEVKNAGVNKGIATMEWLEDQEWDFILAIGDDTTDEDIFKVLPPNAHSIKVGSAPSVAQYRITSVQQVRQLLKLIVGDE